MTQHFPLNYFSNMLTPRKIFAGRRQLNWLQRLLILLFLNALLVIPITMFYTNGLDKMPADTFLADTSLLTDSAAEQVSALQIKEGVLQEADQQIFAENSSGVLGKALGDKTPGTTVISFNEKNWTIKSVVEGKTVNYTMAYTEKFKPEKVNDHASLTTFIEQQFYASNRPTIILSYSLTLGVMVLVMTLLVVAGGAFFLSLTKKSRFSSITSYGESFTLMLLCFGLPSLAALIVGLLHFDFTIMLSIQTFGGVLLLLAVYATTKFKDEERTHDA